VHKTLTATAPASCTIPQLPLPSEGSRAVAGRAEPHTSRTEQLCPPSHSAHTRSYVTAQQADAARRPQAIETHARPPSIISCNTHSCTRCSTQPMTAVDGKGKAPLRVGGERARCQLTHTHFLHAGKAKARQMPANHVQPGLVPGCDTSKALSQQHTTSARPICMQGGPWREHDRSCARHRTLLFMRAEQQLQVLCEQQLALGMPNSVEKARA
jgi:hypothetical protein